jgi:hypothetical protein
MNPTENCTEITDADVVIRRLGGTTKAADVCEVSAQAVSQWRRNGIPKAQLKFLRVARPEVLRADWQPPTPAPTDSTAATH